MNGPQNFLFHCPSPQIILSHLKSIRSYSLQSCIVIRSCILDKKLYILPDNYLLDSGNFTQSITKLSLRVILGSKSPMFAFTNITAEVVRHLLSTHSERSRQQISLDDSDSTSELGNLVTVMQWTDGQLWVTRYFHRCFSNSRHFLYHQDSCSLWGSAIYISRISSVFS